MNEIIKRLAEDIQSRLGDLVIAEAKVYCGVASTAAAVRVERNALAEAIEALIAETSKSTAQPTPTKNTGPCIQDLFAADLLREADENWAIRKGLHAAAADIERRKELGIERYGTVLQPFNGRSALLDAYEELLDGGVYLRQRIEEHLLDPVNVHKNYPGDLHRLYRNIIESIGRLKRFMGE